MGVRIELRRILRNYFGNTEKTGDCATEIEEIYAEYLKWAREADREHLRRDLEEHRWI